MSHKKKYTESAYAHYFFSGMRIRKRKELKVILAIVLLCTSVNAEIANETETCEVIRKEKTTVTKIDCNFMEVLQKSIGTTFESPESEADISALLNRCRQHMKANRLTTGQEGTALDCFRQVLSADPYNAEALEGLQRIESQYIIWADDALRKKNLRKAREYLAGLARVNPESPSLNKLEERIETYDHE